MIMKELTSVEMNAVSGGSCSFGTLTGMQTLQMCVTTAPCTSSCGIYGYDGTHSVYYYNYVATPSSTSSTNGVGNPGGGPYTTDISLITHTTYCPTLSGGGDYYYQNGTYAGSNTNYEACP